MKAIAIAAAIPFVMLGGCATQGASGPSTPAPAPMAQAALAAGDGAARGTATVTEAADGLHVRVSATGLTPGVHAVHVHTTGACTAPDFTSAGGHWNPTGKQHGHDNPAGMHMGDMPNMTVAGDGAGVLEYVIPGGLLATGAMPLLDADGAAVVVHAGPDDNVSDPAGNAGGRVACGVLKAG